MEINDTKSLVDDISKNIIDILGINLNYKNKLINFYEVYVNEKNNFNRYLDLEVIEKTKKEYLFALEKFIKHLNLNLEYEIQIEEIYYKNRNFLNNKEKTIKSFRKFVTFLLKKDFYKFNHLERFLKVSVPRNKNVDKIEIDFDKLKDDFQYLKKRNYYYFLYVRILFYTCLRPKSLLFFLENYDENKKKVYGNIITYELGEMSKTKPQKRFFCEINLFNELLKNRSEMINKYKTCYNMMRKMKVKKEIFYKSKDFRKINTSLLYEFTKLTKEVVYIQGRCEDVSNIVEYHYYCNEKKNSLKVYNEFIKKYGCFTNSNYFKTLKDFF